MNQFLQSTKYFVTRHGVDMQYVSVIDLGYNVELGSADLQKTPHNVRMYPKQILANQYNFPSLIGRELIMFYLFNENLAFSPKVSDEILYKGDTYKIVRYQEHMAYGDICLFRISAVKS